MDQNLRNHLEEKDIHYKTHNHPAVFTVEESKKLEVGMPGVLHTKNLFLKDESQRYFLVCMYAEKRLDLKKLKDELNAKKKLSFANSEQLKTHLNLTPGSVSIFGMIYAKDVTLVLDKQVWTAKKVGFHPNVNTATLEITHENLEKFCDSIDSEIIILDLEDG